ncbi:MAG TPA: penicillin-binding protein 1B [Steroidobacteraceae bacterium]|nr:penicillin-binding protein 1B [Steroidobacteraceae bacterium]
MSSSSPRSRRLRRVLLSVAFFAVLADALFIVYLDRQVTPQFEGRRWTLPAQVYAQPLELYAGLALSANSLEQELGRLHYVPAAELSRPGTYHRRGGRFDIAARRAQFLDEVREAQTISVTTSGRVIERVADTKGQELPIFRLDSLLIGSIFPIHGEDRIVVAPQDVPALLPTALMVVEDRRFETHHGIDPEGILRAAWVNVRARAIEQGGSTLTQQLVRSYFLDDRQTLWRKIKEALMAVILDARFEKTDLMNAYINEIYLGQDGQRAIHGFGLASQFYFGKPLSELNLSEIALLVAVVRGPSYYDPRKHPERARERRDLVLRLLSDFGAVGQKDALKALEQPLGITENVTSGYYPAYLAFVRRTLRRDYREEDLTEAGLQVFTSLDPHVQATAERALVDELTRLDKRYKDKNARLEGAVVVTAPQSGDVVAIVGGRETGLDGFNRALDAKRAIGSLAKPVVYLAALETGRYNAASLIDDAPIDVKLPDGKRWRPENFTHEINGLVPLTRGLADSLNLATVHLGLDVGVANVSKTFARLGLDKAPAQNPALILGAIDLAPIEVAQLYNSLANGGFRTPLRAVRAVVSADGKPLKAFPLEVTPVADSATVYQLNRMLTQVTQRGTGRAVYARLAPDIVVAGKTGTSDDFRDSWFAGFTGSHLAVTWVGFDDNQPTGLTGSAGALSVWSKIMSELDPLSWEAALPESLTDVWIEYATGYKAKPGCAEDLVSVAVPVDAMLPVMPGCGDDPLSEFADRTRKWLEGIIRQ